MEGSRAYVGDSHNDFGPPPEAGVVNILSERWVSLQGLCAFLPTQSVSWGSLGFPGGEGASLIISFPREVVLHCQPQEACGHLLHSPSRPVCYQVEEQWGWGNARGDLQIRMASVIAARPLLSQCPPPNPVPPDFRFRSLVPNSSLGLTGASSVHRAHLGRAPKRKRFIVEKCLLIGRLSSVRWRRTG